MELDFRKQRILQAVVQDYVATAEPVGSQVLVERYSLGVKSATIRNELAEMSERGYLRQPHTSAGRVPSDRGYRFYVNRLMALPVVQEGEIARIRGAVESAASELDAVLRQTCRLLAQLTSLPAVATPPDADDTELRQAFLSPVATDKALLVLLFSTGRTENRLLDETVLTASDALQLANGLKERFAGWSLSALRGLSPDEMPPAPLASFASTWRRLIREVVASARTGTDTPVVVEGTQTVFNHPEFRDVERLAQFLATLQERAAMLEMLGRAVAPEKPTQPGRTTVHVAIGGELGLPELSDYSVVSAAYFVGGRERGSIGVFGPTRMDYAHVAAAVELMARTMGDILTRLSVAP
jgi:heat-inducible transcriptional repressor